MNPFRILAALLLVAAPGLARGEDVRVIGDSIGEGLHLASGIPSPANRFNVAIYTRKALEQLKSAPRGSIVVMSLGTNDAVAGMDEQKAKVDEIVAAAAAQGVKLVWVGPPCVLTRWESHAKALDENLARELAGAATIYVSAQGKEFCAPSLHAGDGVHFTMAGYRMLWQKAAAAAGVPFNVEVASAPAPRAASPHRRSKRIVRHWRKKKAQKEKPDRT